MGGSGIEFRQYFRAVTRRLWLVLILAVVIAAGVYWRTTSQPQQYSARARLMLTTNNLLSAPTSSTNVQSSGTASGGTSRPELTIVNSAIAVITSRPVAQRVATELGISNPASLQGAIRADKVTSTNMIDVIATTADREMAPKVANATARQFVMLFRDANRRDYRDIRLFVASQMTNAKAALDASDTQIQQAKERYAFVDLSAAISQATSELASTRQEIEQTRLRLQEDEAKLASATSRLSTEKITRVYSTEVEDNPVYEQLQERLTALEVERAELSQRYTARHPRMIQVEGSVVAIKQAMTTQARTIVGREVNAINPIHDQLLTDIANLQVDRAAARARLGALGSSLRSRQSAVSAMPAVERRLNGLVRENDLLKANYALLSERHQEALLRENEAGFVPAGVQVMEPAVLPSAPVGLKLPLRTGIGALVGLLLGVIAAIVMETSDDKIRSVQDAERTLGAPVLAQVPDMAPQRVAPGGTVFLLVVLLTVMLGGTLMATNAAIWNGVTARVTQVVR